MTLPTEYTPFLQWKSLAPLSAEAYRPDDRSGRVYCEDEQLQFVTEVAIVTQRPLLLRGEPGSGKSSFAPFIARILGWRYYEHTVTGRTEARDLLWRFDALRRLRDARDGQRRKNISAVNYVTPGPLWWAFNRTKALSLPQSLEPFPEVNAQSKEPRDPLRAVVLIDEIDKADPNVPNDLLEVLGTNRFRVEEADMVVDRPLVPPAEGQHGSLLTVITTNEERDLPAAFLRRCVVHTLGEPGDPEKKLQRLQTIAALHMQPLIDERNLTRDAAGEGNGDAMVKAVARKCLDLRTDPKKQRPSVAEFLDALRFCLTRGFTPTHDKWDVVEKSVLLKK
ncbi:AAA family ATPase [Prosthecobacter sp.]|uniref:AAA family ATPase n=1 Tax=Prosthecobacter sp. TaxID=1965333 RepID=UPI003784164D